MWPKLKTALVVIVLSCLIWILAEQEVTQEAAIKVKLELKSSAQNIFVQLLDQNDNPIAGAQKEVELTVKIPAGKMQNFHDEYLDNIKLDISKFIELAPDKNREDNSFPVISLLDGKLYSRDERSYLHITKSSPKTIKVRVTRLTQRPIPVKVYDSRGVELGTSSLNPSSIKLLVMDDWLVEARVDLTPDQQRQAMQDEITVNCSAGLSDRVIKTITVNLKLLQDTNRRIRSLSGPRLGIIKTRSIDDKYKVVFEDDSQLEEYNRIECQGSTEALDAYQKSDYYILLEIKESDIGKSSSSRLPRYNLPSDFGRIEVTKEPTPISFHLEAIPVNN